MTGEGVWQPLPAAEVAAGDRVRGRGAVRYAARAGKSVRVWYGEQRVGVDYYADETVSVRRGEGS